jgi:hypothetical protein
VFVKNIDLLPKIGEACPISYTTQNVFSTSLPVLHFLIIIANKCYLMVADGPTPLYVFNKFVGTPFPTCLITIFHFCKLLLQTSVIAMVADGPPPPPTFVHYEKTKILSK